MNESQMDSLDIREEASELIEIVELEARHNQVTIDPATSCSCNCTSCSIIIHGTIEY